MRKGCTLLAPVFLLCVGIASSILLGSSYRLDWIVIKSFRIPRTFLAAAVGGGLSVSGALIQGLMANPLADPFTMGSASAAALGAILVSLYMGYQHPFYGPMVAFVFALLHLGALIVFFRQPLQERPKEFILIGVISGFIFSSIGTLALALSKPDAWSYSMGWIFGSVRQASIGESLALFAGTLMFSGMSLFFWKPLDMISVNAELASTSGVDLGRKRIQIFLLSSLLTAFCVAAAGIVGFVGLLVPHLIRALGLSSYRLLIPSCYMAGAGLLCASDALSRIVAYPSELPVGVITALAGGPCFLYLMRRPR